MRKKRNDSPSIGNVAIFSASASFFFSLSGPLSVVAFSNQTIQTSLQGFILAALVVGTILGLLCFSVLLALRLFTPRLSRYAMHFIASWLILTIIFFPVASSQTLGSTTTSEFLSRFTIVLLITIAVSFATYRLWVQRKLNAAPVALAAGIASLLVFQILSFSAFSSTKNAKDLEDFYSLSTQGSVLTVSFDGIPGPIVRGLLEAKTDTNEAFQDFIFFENAVAPAPATAASIMAEQYGDQSYHDIGDSIQDVIGVLGLENSLASSVEKSWAFGAYGEYMVNQNMAFYTGDLSGVQAPSPLHVLATERVLGLAGTFFAERVVAAFAFDEPYLGPSWSSFYHVDEMDYNTFVSSMRADGTKTETELRQLHFVHTHFPVEYDKDCNFLGFDPEWHVVDWQASANQNYENLQNQTECALSQFALLIQKLKLEGVYDNTTIILKSDHGEPSTYFEEFPSNLTINGHELWGYSRYEPLLMIKPQGRNVGSVEFDQRPVTLADLAKTVCILLDSKEWHSETNCERFKGGSLLEASPLPAHLYIQVVEGPSSSFRFDDHLTVKLPRTTPIWRALEATEGVTLFVPEK